MTNLFMNPDYDHRSNKFMRKAFENVFLFVIVGGVLGIVNALQVLHIRKELSVHRFPRRLSASDLPNSESLPAVRRPTRRPLAGQARCRRIAESPRRVGQNVSSEILQCYGPHSFWGQRQARPAHPSRLHVYRRRGHCFQVFVAGGPCDAAHRPDYCGTLHYSGQGSTPKSFKFLGNCLPRAIRGKNALQSFDHSERGPVYGEHHRSLQRTKSNGGTISRENKRRSVPGLF